MASGLAEKITIVAKRIRPDTTVADACGRSEKR
jgi:hypothetical protein